MGEGQSPFMMCQSLWHTPDAFILTRTSPALGGSSSQSTTCKGSLGLNRTAAFIGFPPATRWHYSTGLVDPAPEARSTPAKEKRPGGKTMRAPNRRTVLRGGVGLSALAVGVLPAPAVVAQGKPFAGTTINASCFQTTYFEYLKNYFPAFEERTGIKVNFNMQAFPVYNQRTDLELSTKGSALDVINVTFIYSGRWIGAGWVTNLDTFTKDAKLTPADWDPDDFAGGPQSAMKNAKGETFGFTWEAGAMILGAARYDLIERAGLGLPKTFDELIKVCDAVHNKDGVAAFTADKLHHWN